MKKEVKLGDTVNVTVALEFEGTVRNHAILVENQFIPTRNNGRKDFPIILDGDPIQVSASFIGTPGSKIKSFTITINGKTGASFSNIKFKYQTIDINVPVPYSKFDLKLVA